MRRIFSKRFWKMAPAMVLCLLCLTASFAWADEDRAAVQKEIESASDLSPRAQKVLFSARGHQDEGQFEEAAETVNEWLTKHPDAQHPLLSFNLAVSYLNQGQSADALANFEQAVQQEPRFARAWLRLGEAAYDQRDFGRAAEAFGQGYDLMPDPSPEIEYYSAVAWLLADQPTRSLSVLEPLLDEHRADATLDWYQALVSAVSVVDDHADNRARLDQGLVDFESDPRAWELAYQFAASAEDYKQAVVYLTVVGHLRDLTRNELLQLGDLCSATGVPLQAARNYARALEFPESSPQEDDYRRLASAWMAAYQNDEARAALARGLEKKPSAGLYSLLGDLDYSEEDFEGARAAFDRCVELDPDYGRGWLMSGYCSLELGDTGRARVSLVKAAGFEGQKRMAENLIGRLGE